MHKELIKDIGEKELIKRLADFMPKKQVTDDCAFIKINNENLLLNTDLMVEDTHFNDSIISPFDIGWKAVSINVSDLVSSGCTKIIGINIGLVLPRETEWLWVKGLYEGINKALKHYGGSILGGDCSLGTKRMISINAIGIQGELKLRRNLCIPGDVILTTDAHGLSKLGLMLKSNLINENNILLSEDLVKKSIQKFCKPRIKQEILEIILTSRTEKKRNEIGCTDSSDGLYQSLIDLCTESHCKAIIDYEKLPKDKNWPSGNTWDNYYFFGGEDYELIFALPRNWANALLKNNPEIREIGYFIEGKASVKFVNCKINEFSNGSAFSHF